MQKYPRITESYACILKIFGIIFLLFINFFISFSAQPQSYQSMSQLRYLHENLSNEFQYQNNHLD